MAFSFFDNAGSGVLSATQNGLLGQDPNLLDIPGATLTLTHGTWLVMAHFHARNWQLNTSYAKTHHTCQLTDSANNVINGLSYMLSIDTQNEQRSDGTLSMTTTIGVASGTYVVKMRGASAMVVGTNFSTGFRWDSGAGGPCTIRAVKVGP